MFASLWILSAISIDARLKWRVALGFFPALGSILVVYLCFCGVRYLFGTWSDDHYKWWAYMLGPPLVLFAITLPIVAVIGFIGNQSQDWRREWWTRLGAWTGISGVGFLAVSLTSVFAPLLALSMFDRWGTWQWSTVLGWIATVVGGLLSGNSDKTEGEKGRTWTAWALEVFSKFAAVAFIVGSVFFASTALHVIILAIVSDLTLASDYWTQLNAIRPIHYWEALGVLLALGLLFSWRFEINIFGLNQFYRNRLVRCYLGATRWGTGLRQPHNFTGFDEGDELLLSDFSNRARSAKPYRGPFPILNGALNLGGSSDLGLHTRHSASFTFTPLRAGADRKAVGYSPVAGDPRFAGGLNLGQVVSVSGAAASPNMGYSTSPLVAFLLTMFNVRLAWWFPNPGRRWWSRPKLPLSTWYLVKEMFGLADETNRFINVSDGGHFENLGIYELVRRRCRVIVACDAECDSKLTFGSLGNVIRLCETDFRARIDIDVESIRRGGDSGVSRAHCAVGRITYSNGSRGYLIYLKSSLTGDEDVSVERSHASHDEFPHETTGDQFFAEDQFESYRRLGYHIARMTFRDVEQDASLVEMAHKLANIWAPAAVGNGSFTDQTRALDEIWERFRATATLHPLLVELMANRPSPPPSVPTEEQLVMCMELFQLMENVYVALRLADFWEHPDNRGWVVLFTMWAKSGTFRMAWTRTRDTFSIGFVYLCEPATGDVWLNGRRAARGGAKVRACEGSVPPFTRFPSCARQRSSQGLSRARSGCGRYARRGPGFSHPGLDIVETERRQERAQRPRRRVHLSPFSPCRKLGVVEEFVHGVHARVGDLRALQAIDNLLCGPSREGLHDDRLELVVVFDAEGVRAETRVTSQSWLIEHVGTEPGPLPLVLESQVDDEHHRLPCKARRARWRRGAHPYAAAPRHRSPCNKRHIPSTRPARRTSRCRAVRRPRSFPGGRARQGSTRRHTCLRRYRPPRCRPSTESRESR